MGRESGLQPAAASGTTYIDALLTSTVARWGGAVGTSATVTFSFLDTLPTADYAAGDEEASGFTYLSDAQRAVVRQALALWSEVSGITFVEADYDAGDIRFGSAALPLGVDAWAYSPGATGTAGDVWLSTLVAANNAPAAGTAGFATLLHVIGHALGLKHPGDYDDIGGVGASEGPYLSTDTDTVQYSVMSYNDHAGVTAQPSTLMLYDIAAIQYLYGARTAIRTSADVYAWSWEADVLQTIWDGGGTDAIDASNQSRSQVIDLRAGGFSSIGIGLNNVAIAYGAVIENALGGSGADTIYGNSAGNVLTGGGGYDTFILSGTWGDDTLVDSGSNELRLDADRSQLSVRRSGRDLVITRTATSETATVRNVYDTTSGASRQGWRILANGVLLNIDLPGNKVPTVTGENVRVRPNGEVSAVSLFTATDGDGDDISRYQFWDSGSGAGSGYFRIAGNAQSANQLIEASAADLLTMAYVGGGQDNQEKVWVRVYDGYDWSEWASWTMSAVNNAPQVAVGDRTISSGASIAASQLMSPSDADGDGMTQYEFWDSGAGANSGHFVLSGVTQAAGAAIAVTAAQLSSLTFVGGVSDGVDLLWARAYDGTAWSEWGSWRMQTTGGNRAPAVSASRRQVNAQSHTSASSLFSVVDLDGDGIVSYELWDSSSASSSGYFSVAGVAQPANTAISVTAAQLAQTTFIAGAGAGEDSVWLRAYDGVDWSEWSNWSITTINHLPNVSVGSRTVDIGGVVAISDVLSASDPESAAISLYQFWDSGSFSGSGYFRVGGAEQPAQQTITVTAADLGGVAYIGGGVAGDDSVWARVWDGGDWSEWSGWTFSTRGGGAGTQLTGQSQIVGFNVSKALSAQLTATPATGRQIQRYELWDSGVADYSGYFTVGGRRQNANTAISVSAAEFSGAAFVGGLSSGPEVVWARAYDGVEWTGWSSWTMNTGYAPTSAAAAIAGG